MGGGTLNEPKCLKSWVHDLVVIVALVQFLGE